MTNLERLLHYRAIDEPSGCWCWSGGSDRSTGYGVAWDALRRRPTTAHRLAAIEWLGLASGSQLQVLHKCSNRLCFNPDHLKIGTHYDNMQDRKAAGNYAQPDKARKLNWEGVRLIRELRFKGYSQSRLARAFGVNQKVIRGIVANEIWVEVA